MEQIHDLQQQRGGRIMRLNVKGKFLYVLVILLMFCFNAGAESITFSVDNNTYAVDLPEDYLIYVYGSGDDSPLLKLAGKRASEIDSVLDQLGSSVWGAHKTLFHQFWLSVKDRSAGLGTVPEGQALPKNIVDSYFDGVAIGRGPYTVETYDGRDYYVFENGQSIFQNGINYFIATFSGHNEVSLRWESGNGERTEDDIAVLKNIIRSVHVQKESESAAAEKTEEQATVPAETLTETSPETPSETTSENTLDSNQEPEAPPEQKRKQDQYYANGNIETKYEYNSNSQLQKTTYYNRFGQIEHYEVAEAWDDAGNVIEETDYYPESEAPYDICHYRYVYNGQGKVLTLSGTNADGSDVWQYTNEYNAQGDKIRSIYYGENGSVISYNEDYVFDSDDNLISYTELDADRNVIRKYNATWENGVRVSYTEIDGQGNLTSQYTFDPIFGDELTGFYTWNGDDYSVTYTYNNDSYVMEYTDINRGYNETTTFSIDGHKTRMKTYRKDSETGIWTLNSQSEYSINSEGNEICKQTNADGSSSYQETDSHRHILLRIDYDVEGSLKSKTKYEYDSNGREVRRSIFGPDDQLEMYYISEYDVSGKTKRENHYNADGQLEGYWVNEYDDQGQMTRMALYRSDDTVSYENFYRYLSDGTIQRKTIDYNADGTVRSEGDWK
jgi:hypothetical protein